MTNVQERGHLTPEELLEGAKQLDISELEQFAQRVLSLQAQRQNGSLNKEDTLIKQIKQGFPVSFQKRYRYLNARRRAEKLTPDELHELQTMIEEMEALSVKRLEALSQLAKMRGMSLDAVMRDLDVQGQRYA